MKASKTLQRPSNWQDFESLSKKLWGEIWDCPEIKKNGRAGQVQHGVDICGIPKGEIQYFGVQCKGKDEYTNKQLTEIEITTEIEKAKKFQPSLRKFYFVTTAVKDTKIEEFVRKLNVHHLVSNLFEVHLYSWEDIVDLIYENKQTHDWYVNSQNFKTTKSVAVTFKGGEKEIVLSPKFKRLNVNYIQRIIPTSGAITLGQFRDRFTNPDIYISEDQIFKTSVNLSYASFQFQIQNTGSQPVEEFKLLFTIEGEIQEITVSNEKGGILNLHNLSGLSDVSISSEETTGLVTPKRKILVSDDKYISDEIFIKPFPKESNISVFWKLISKDHKDAGELNILFKPEIDMINKEILVDDPFKVGIFQGDVEDTIIIKPLISSQ